MEIAFAGELTAKDLQQAWMLHQKAPRWAHALTLAMLCITLAGLAGNAVAGLWPMMQGTILRGSAYVPLMVFAAAVIAFPWLQRSMVAGQAKAPGAVLRRWGRASEQGFAVETEVSRLRFDWAGAVKYARSDEMVLLYLQPGAYHIFPRHFFADDADWQAFNRLAQASLAEAAPLGRGSAARSLLIFDAIVFAVALVLYFVA